jgi:hypothetical protein
MRAARIRGAQQGLEARVAGHLVVQARGDDELGIAADAPRGLDHVGHGVPGQDVLGADVEALAEPRPEVAGDRAETPDRGQVLLHVEGQ